MVVRHEAKLNGSLDIKMNVLHKEYVQEIGVLIAFLLLIAGSLGCATLTTLSAIEDRPSTIALSDEIIAIQMRR